VEFRQSDKWDILNTYISSSLTDVEVYKAIYNSDFLCAEQSINVFGEIKDLAALGDISARNSIIDHFVKVLSSPVFENTNNIIEELIDFEKIEKNDNCIIFEILINNINLCEILDKYKVNHLFSKELLVEIALNENINRRISIKYEKRRSRISFIAGVLYAITYGQDCIDSLQYQDINEIGVLNKDYIYITYKGNKIKLDFLSFNNRGTIINIQKKTTLNSSLNFDRQNPIIVTAKINSSRISAAGYDVTPYEEDVYYNERIFNLKKISLYDLKEQFGTINEYIYNLLIFNQNGKGSFLVTGSDMGVGKSTFLLSMLEQYPDSWGIGILDPQNELQAGKKYPLKNVLTIVENARKDLSKSFAYMLKTSRDVMVVSEITMPEEVSELVNSALRLNAGVCATMHSLSPEEVVPNLRNLMLRTDMYQNKSTAEEDISGSIDLIIHLKRTKNGKIVVHSIHEIFCENMETFNYSNIIKNGTEEEVKLILIKLAAYALQEHVTGRHYYLRKLIEFDEGNNDWVIYDIPSERYLNKMSRYADKSLLDSVLQYRER